ncbi:hypothetical protein [Sphingopyxis flava]|uniref:Uncharacterized protein n=1 Tax=Sphingopyxis flava TaxID=1507287 RepID=A0A1T5B3W6_9SPHN|nr:hypothetical protein [Sphingopyxis flava]SKB42001.1 hypothetical protein SAMN06295937_1005123 [Sphingopyxis flava]
MLMHIDEMQARLDALVTALDGQDAGAIIAASEALATAVILFRGAPIPVGREARARVLIGDVLKQLEAAAIRVNVLKDWTRQRIDRNHALRGMAPRGAALTY